MHYHVTEDDLKAFLRNHNLKVAKVRILLNGQGQSKGSGTIDFCGPQDAEFAVNNLNGAEIMQRRI